MRSRVSSKLLLLIIPFLLISLMSENTFAASLNSIDFLKISRSGDGAAFSETIRVNSSSYLPVLLMSIQNATTYRINYVIGERALPSSASGQYFNMKLNLEFNSDLNYTFSNLNCLGADGYVLPEQGNIENYSSSVQCESTGKLIYYTIVTTGKLSQDTNVSSFYWDIDNFANMIYSCSNLSGSQVPPCTNNRLYLNSMALDYEFSQDPSLFLLQTQIEQNNTIINQNEEMINRENQAIDNIDNQTTSDISDAENQATTNLIGVLSNFFIQLQNFQATNCNLDLPFPEFIGGTQTVNICQGKDVLGNFITVIGTLAMVGFYIPLAWVLLKMIYNEIRSFTNG